MKKINCKPGLSPKEEIIVRRWRKSVLADEENKELIERIKKLWKKFLPTRDISLYSFIKQNDNLVHSLCERIGGVEIVFSYIKKYKE